MKLINREVAPNLTFSSRYSNDKTAKRETALWKPLSIPIPIPKDTRYGTDELRNFSCHSCTIPAAHFAEEERCAASSPELERAIARSSEAANLQSI